MTRQYKVLLPLAVHTADGSYTQGDVFEKEFTAEEEAANLDSGLLELQPAAYRVTGDNEVYGHKPGETFEQALRMHEEAHLLAAGAVELVDVEPEPETKPSTRKKKEA